MGGQTSKFETKRCHAHEKAKFSLGQGRGLQLICANSGEASKTVSSLATFDVFLNHRGVDTKAKFVRYLEEELTRAGLRPFLDAKHLVTGEHAFESIDQALEEAQVHVAIVSKRYFESKWCMNELLAMFRSGKPIIPVFYEVEPRDLCLGSTRRTAAFERHLQKGRVNEVKAWGNALQNLAEITGFRSAAYEGDEVRLKNTVVKEVERLMPTNQLLRVDEYQVGLKWSVPKCVAEFESMGVSTGILSIVGMGGIGKTALSRNVYNWYATHKTFARMTFLGDVHSACMYAHGGYGQLAELQKQLLWDLLRVPRESYIHDYWYWFQRLSRRGRPVFIVLDNIDNDGELQQLVPDMTLLPSGSRVIVTSRRRGMLDFRDGGIKLREYQMKCLNSSNALKLFNWHAFGVKSTPNEFENFVPDIVQACCGLPLALKIIGSTLSTKKSIEDQEDIWPEAVQTLKECGDILEVLKWSYDSLQSEEEKLMFLDTAWFCNQMDKTIAFHMWEACRSCASCSGFRKPRSSMRNLEDRFLVEEEDGKLVMHDMLREMAQFAVRSQSSSPVKRSHHWEVSVAENILARNQMQVANQIRGLSVAGSSRTLVAESIGSMERLHFLVSDGCSIVGDFTLFPKDLRLLQWREMPFRQLPSELKISTLTTLDLSFSTKMAHLWTNSNINMQDCCNLRVLNLDHCDTIKSLPESLGFCSELRILSCYRCMDLESLPGQISGLSRLQKLHISYCLQLKSLPDEVSTLSSLDNLNISFCLSLKVLPGSIGQLKQLRELDICMSEKLPDNIGDLSQLKKVHLGGNLLSLPDSFGRLSALEDLTIGCGAIQEFPASVGSLVNLKRLWCEGNFDLKELPESFCDLTNLEVFCLTNWGLLSLPVNFGRLSKLRVLTLDYLHDLVRLPTNFGCLTNLESLDLSACPSLRELPASFTDLRKLETLDLCWNSGLICLPEDLSRLSNLKKLILHACVKLETLPSSIVELPKLHTLELCEAGITCLPENLTRLSSLRVLDLSDCPNLSDHVVKLGFKRQVPPC